MEREQVGISALSALVSLQRTALMLEKSPFANENDRNRIVRCSRKSDVAAVRQIFAEANLTTLPNADFSAEAATEWATPTFLVCELEHVIVGALCWRSVPPDAEILDVAVRTVERRRGHAASLLSNFLDLTSKAGIEKIFLEVRASNSAAIALYKKFGFVPLAHRPNYYRNPDEAAVMMTRVFG